MKHFLITTLTALMLSSCGSDEDNEAAETTESTISLSVPSMVYVNELATFEAEGINQVDDTVHWTINDQNYKGNIITHTFKDSGFYKVTVDYLIDNEALSEAKIVNVITPHSPPTLFGVVLGDLNLDKQVNKDDFMYLDNFLRGNETDLSVEQTIAADLNLDGFIDNKDELLLQALIESNQRWINSPLSEQVFVGIPFKVASTLFLDIDRQVKAYINDVELDLSQGLLGYGSITIPKTVDIIGETKLNLINDIGNEVSFSIQITQPEVIVTETQTLKELSFKNIARLQQLLYDYKNTLENETSQQKFNTAISTLELEQLSKDLSSFYDFIDDNSIDIEVIFKSLSDLHQSSPVNSLNQKSGVTASSCPIDLADELEKARQAMELARGVVLEPIEKLIGSVCSTIKEYPEKEDCKVVTKPLSKRIATVKFFINSISQLTKPSTDLILTSSSDFVTWDGFVDINAQLLYPIAKNSCNAINSVIPPNYKALLGTLFADDFATDPSDNVYINSFIDILNGPQGKVTISILNEALSKVGSLVQEYIDIACNNDEIDIESDIHSCLITFNVIRNQDISGQLNTSTNIARYFHPTSCIPANHDVHIGAQYAQGYTIAISDIISITQRGDDFCGTYTGFSIEKTTVNNELTVDTCPIGEIKTGGEVELNIVVPNTTYRAVLNNVSIPVIVSNQEAKFSGTVTYKEDGGIVEESGELSIRLSNQPTLNYSSEWRYEAPAGELGIAVCAGTASAEGKRILKNNY